MDLTSLATTGISGKAAKFISKVPDALEEVVSTDFSDPYQYPELAIVLASLASPFSKPVSAARKLALPIKWQRKIDDKKRKMETQR